MKDNRGHLLRRICRGLFLGVIFAALSVIAEAKPAKSLDLADTVAAKPILSKMAAMVQASDLGTFLSSRGPFTLFAPTNSAFAKLPAGTLEELLRPENKVRLQDILLFHLVNGKKVMEMDLGKAPSLLSCEGSPLLLKKTRSGAQLVVKAKIVNADIRCQNGVIHEIDTVLMPPEASLPPLAPPASVTPAAPADSTNAPPVSA